MIEVVRVEVRGIHAIEKRFMRENVIGTEVVAIEDIGLEVIGVNKLVWRV